MEDGCAVSVLVPICNVERYLSECLSSLVNQTLDSLQIICIDDGSTDSSPEIIEEFARRDRRISVITKENSGYGDSMNKGFEAAKGEYVGIVESDDFASPDMFETLYRRAKKLDADVVKENFLTHMTAAPVYDDEPIDNLMLGSYGALQGPGSDDVRSVMRARPAIWSALYRRRFLEDNGIRFLPTPGASFQDTSFNFKALACARRIAFFPTAHLHYRIDNDNSSVKSKAKADFICGEYGEICQWAQKMSENDSWLLEVVPPIQFGGYEWNLERLSEELRYAFYCRFVDEFRAYQHNGHLVEAEFHPAAWAKLASMLEDADGYFARTYGPIEVNKTCVLSVNAQTVSHVGEAVSAVNAKLGTACEILVDCPDECLEDIESVIEALRSEAPNVYSASRSFNSRALKDIPPERFRGAETIAVSWKNPSDDLGSLVVECAQSKNEIAVAQHSSIAVAYKTEELTSAGLPLTTMLLPTLFYRAKARALSWDEFKRVDIQAAASTDTAVTQAIGIADYRKAFASFKALIGNLEKCSYLEGTDLKALLMPLWARLQCAFDHLSAEDRKLVEPRPTVESLPVFTYDGCGGNDQKARVVDERPHLTVVIPVYNTEGPLIDCVESVLFQTEKSLEVICVDDGSTDRSLRVLEQLADADARIRVVTQFNGGAGSARNTAISIARGEYLAFIDSDDVYPSIDTLETLYKAAAEHDARICGGSFALIGPEGKLDENDKRYHDENKAYLFHEERFRKFLEDQFDYGWIRFIYHRSLFEEGVRFPNLAFYEDPVFFASMMRVCPKYYAVPIDAYCYSTLEAKQNWTTRQVRDLLKGVDANLAFAEERGYPSLFATLVKRLNTVYCDAIVEAADDDEVIERLVGIQGRVFASKYTEGHLLGGTSRVLKALDVLRAPEENAVVRLARKVGESSLYKGLQQRLWDRRALARPDIYDEEG